MLVHILKMWNTQILLSCMYTNFVVILLPSRGRICAGFDHLCVVMEVIPIIMVFSWIVAMAINLL